MQWRHRRRHNLVVLVPILLALVLWFYDDTAVEAFMFNGPITSRLLLPQQKAMCTNKKHLVFSRTMSDLFYRNRDDSFPVTNATNCFERRRNTSRRHLSSSSSTSQSATTAASSATVSSSRRVSLRQRLSLLLPNHHKSGTKEIPSSASLSSSQQQRVAKMGLSKTEEKEDAVIPSYKRLLIFTIGTVSIMLSEPILSLVDTSIVGMTQSNAVVQLAALGPATTLYDSLLYLTCFLAMAMTTQLGKCLAEKDYTKCQKVTSHILGTAATVGALISLLMFTFGKLLIQNMAGNSGTKELIQLATRYVHIRALVAPLSVLVIVAQSFCLVNLDTATPIIAVGVASIVNIIGDLALSCSFGIQGAAVATALASATSSIILLRKVKERMYTWRAKTTTTTKTTTASLTTPPKLHDNSTTKPETIAASITDEDENKEISSMSDALVRDSSSLKQHSKMTMVPKNLIKHDMEAATATFVVEKGATLTTSRPDTTTTTEIDNNNGLLEAMSELHLQEEEERRKQKPNQKHARGGDCTTITKVNDKNHHEEQIIPLLSLPNKASLLSLLKLSGPIFCTMVCKMFCYAAITLRAADFGVTKLASHNIMIRIFYFFTSFGDSLSQTAQSFLPQVLYSSSSSSSATDNQHSTDNTNNVSKVRKLLMRLVIFSTLVGICNSQVAQGILQYSGGGTSGPSLSALVGNDPQILQTIRELIPVFGCSILLHPIIMLFEGTLLSTRDYGALCTFYGTTVLIHFGLLKFACPTFGAIWSTLLLFQLIRFLQFGLRVLWKTNVFQHRHSTKMNTA